MRTPAPVPAERAPGTRPPGRFAVLAALALLAAVTAGCASRRELIVTSTPPGALVRVGDELVGETPVRHRFTHYGAVRVTLYDERHLTYSRVVELEPPWYGYPVIDVVTDLFPWRDRHLLHVRLQPLTADVTAGEVDSILQRAEVLRRAGPEGPDRMPERKSQQPRPLDDDPGEPPEADPAGPVEPDGPPEAARRP